MVLAPRSSRPAVVQKDRGGALTGGCCGRPASGKGVWAGKPQWKPEEVAAHCSVAPGGSQGPAASLIGEDTLLPSLESYSSSDSAIPSGMNWILSIFLHVSKTLLPLRHSLAQKHSMTTHYLLNKLLNILAWLLTPYTICPNPSQYIWNKRSPQRNPPIPAHDHLPNHMVSSTPNSDHFYKCLHFYI